MPRAADQDRGGRTPAPAHPATCSARCPDTGPVIGHAGPGPDTAVTGPGPARQGAAGPVGTI